MVSKNVPLLVRLMAAVFQAVPPKVTLPIAMVLLAEKPLPERVILVPGTALSGLAVTGAPTISKVVDIAPLVEPVAATVLIPRARLGTVRVPAIPPDALAVIAAVFAPALVPPNLIPEVMAMVSVAIQSLPVTVTVLPTTPLLGVRVRVGFRV